MTFDRDKPKVNRQKIKKLTFDSFFWRQLCFVSSDATKIFFGIESNYRDMFRLFDANKKIQVFLSLEQIKLASIDERG